MAVRLLLKREGKEERSDDRDEADRCCCCPAPRRGLEKDHRFGQHEERGEVVRRQRQRGDHHPPGVEASARSAQRPQRQQQGNGAEQCQERVRASLLRVPDQEGIGRDQRSRDRGCPCAPQLPPDPVGDRNQSDPADCRDRPQPDLCAGEHLHPQPRDEVVERGSRFEIPDSRQHVAQRAVDEVDGADLVPPESLGAQRAEADGCRKQDQSDQGGGSLLSGSWRGAGRSHGQCPWKAAAG